MIEFHPKPTGGCVITMSDQETGAPPPDPNTPSQTSETAMPAEDQGKQQPKSPDEDPGNEAREGGTETHPRSGSSDEDEGDES